MFTDADRLRVLAPDDRFIELDPRGPLTAAADAEIAIGGGSPDELSALIAAAPKLCWFACVAAGVEGLVGAGLAGRPGLVVTKNSGPQDIPIAEHAIALMFAAAKRLREYGHAQDERRWIEELPHGELEGATVVVFGLGSVGREVARRISALGMRVIGVRRTQERGTSDVSSVVGPADLPHVITEADYLVITAPLTTLTRGAISAALLARMKPTAWIVNVARGAIVDEPSMIERLRGGQLGGAALDVVSVEPLSRDSTLWSLPNVILTPHVASSSPTVSERTMRAFVANLGRWKRGEGLVNVVDPERGY